MCGIAGIQVNQQDKQLTVARRHSLLKELLRGIEVRGKDAAGVAFRDGKGGEVFIQKSDYKPTQLATELDDDGGKWTTAIAHARFATQGSPKNNDNNHPIQVDSYVGVHNGVIYNDDAIFDSLLTHEVKRIAEVDTEAVFAMLRYGARLFPDASDNRHELLTLVEGSAALAWLITTDNLDTLFVARASGSPLAVGHTVGKSFIFASTKAILERACQTAGVTLNKSWEVKQGTALRIRNGRVITTDNFVPDQLTAKIYKRPDYSRGTKYSAPKRIYAQPTNTHWTTENNRLYEHYTGREDKYEDYEREAPFVFADGVNKMTGVNGETLWYDPDSLTWIDEYGAEYDGDGLEITETYEDKKASTELELFQEQLDEREYAKGWPRWDTIGDQYRVVK